MSCGRAEREPDGGESEAERSGSLPCTGGESQRVETPVAPREMPESYRRGRARARCRRAVPALTPHATRATAGRRGAPQFSGLWLDRPAASKAESRLWRGQIDLQR
jgi:hypothetical protein